MSNTGFWPTDFQRLARLCSQVCWCTRDGMVNEGNYRIDEKRLLDSLSQQPRLQYEERVSQSASLPTSLRIETFNLGGATDRENLAERMQHCDFNGVDIACLQELSKHVPPNIPFGWWRSKIPDGAGCDVYPLIASRYEPESVLYWEMPGCLDYSNSLVIAAWTNLTVLNCYWQAGSFHSKGLWKKFVPIFHEQRKRAFEFAVSLASRSARIVICGDFNCDWRGRREYFPELEVMRHFQSAFPEEFSENSEENELRKAKKVKKQATVDGFFCRGDLVLRNPLLSHREPFLLQNAQRWHVSDHFGVTVDVQLDSG